MKKLFSKVLTFVLVFVLGTSTLIASGCNGGNQFKSLIVGGVSTTYCVGEEVNFDNAVVKVEYTDTKENKTLTKNEYSVELPNGMSILSDLTKEEGAYTVKFVYLDPLFKGERREKAIVINVVAEDVEYVEGQVLTPTSFNLPETYGVYQSNIASATNERNNEETDSSFEGKFMDVEDKNYYVGTDNGFKFLPKLRVNKKFRRFTAKIEISVEIENAPVKLIASTPVDKVVTYTLNDEEVATVDIYNHIYKFEDALDGKKVKVSIEPSTTIYNWDKGALTAEFVIVKDAYNVHNAVEFSVLDNVNDNHDWSAAKVTNVNWANWKTENNINVVTDGIILHDNITITKEAMPEDFFWKNTETTTYTDANNNEMYADTYAFDNTDFYWRNIEQGKSFQFLGNYFTVDMSALPVVASNNVNCANNRKYGNDYSNVSALKFVGAGRTKSSLIVKNVSLYGNANVSSFKDKDGDPYYSGGVSMFKCKMLTTNFENSIVKTSFISFFPDGGKYEPVAGDPDAYGEVNFKNVKAYDSNQSAIFTYKENVINMENCYMERAGGPLIMLRDADTVKEGWSTTLNIKDCHLVSKVCGQELFFTSKGVNTYVGMIALINRYVQESGFGNYVTMKGETSYLNAVVLILSENNNPSAIIGSLGTDGKVVIQDTTDSGTKTFTATRMASDNVMKTVNLIYNGATDNGKNANEQTIPPIFACEDTDSLISFYNGMDDMAYPVDILPGFSAQEKQYLKNATKASFQNSNYIGLYYGGMTLVMGLNH